MAGGQKSKGRLAAGGPAPAHSAAMEIAAAAERPQINAWAFAVFTAAAMALYYYVLFYPPILLGSNDPDRYYHLALARMTVEHGGLLHVLPQVEDLGWGHYFPDKEFLFHVLCGLGYWLAGPDGTLALVPACGIAVALLLYSQLLKVLSPARAAFLVVPVLLSSCAFLFRLSVLRPHLLAIVFFCVLLAGLLRARPWVCFVATLGFALAYHALYIPVTAVAVACLVRWEDPRRMRRCFAFALAGLCIGVIVNPYFPSNLVMSLEHLTIALGIGLPPGLQSGTELQPIGLDDFLDWFVLLPIAVIGAIWARRREPVPGQASNFRFLFLLVVVFGVLALKSSRATEYAIPTSILLLGHVLSRMPARAAAASIVLVLVAQAHAAWDYYDDSFTSVQGGDSAFYFDAVSRIPANARGAKVFNCEWATGSYLLLARPDLRFVDLLEPAFLWHADRHKYVLRQNLEFGTDPKPLRTLRDTFHADYVVCANEGLVRQMRADPRHFQALTPLDDAGAPIKTFRIHDDVHVDVH
jgi:hypothetical protein